MLDIFLADLGLPSLGCGILEIERGFCPLMLGTLQSELAAVGFGKTFGNNQSQANACCSYCSRSNWLNALICSI